MKVLSRLVHDVNNKLLYGLDEYRKHMHTKKIAPSSLKKFGTVLSFIAHVYVSYSEF